jgi:hypothetical protein
VPANSEEASEEGDYVDVVVELGGQNARVLAAFVEGVIEDGEGATGAERPHPRTLLRGVELAAHPGLERAVVLVASQVGASAVLPSPVLEVLQQLIEPLHALLGSSSACSVLARVSVCAGAVMSIID